MRIRDVISANSAGALEVFVHSPDREGLFFRICAGLASAGASIIDARVHTTRDGMALDNFLVQDPLGRPFDEAARLNRIKASIADSLANRSKLQERLKTRPLSRPRADAFPIEPNVLIDNKASNRFTVIEVNARDRPALLFSLANALFQSKVTVHSAHVATYGERAVDVFYLTDLHGGKIQNPVRLKSLQARVLHKAFRGAEFLYTLQLDSGQVVQSLVPSHHDHAVGQRDRQHRPGFQRLGGS